MTEQECAKVLAKIQLVDNRQVDRLTLAEWFDIVGHLDFQAAIAAVRVHRQTSTEYLQPGHIVRIVEGFAAVRERERTQRMLEDTRVARARGVPMPADYREQVKRGLDRKSIHGVSDDS